MTAKSNSKTVRQTSVLLERLTSEIAGDIDKLVTDMDHLTDRAKQSRTLSRIVRSVNPK
jgi:hypothetical protein